MPCPGYGRPVVTILRTTPTSPARTCSTPPSRPPVLRGLAGAATSHAIWSGNSPHKKIAGTAPEWYIMPGSTKPMRRADPSGRRCHWILEIHLIDPLRRFGGFYEQLLDLG